MSERKVAAALWRRLPGKVPVITGDSGGIGEAKLRLFADHGAKVIIADISDDAGMKVAESLSPCATYVRCDASKEEDVSATVDLAIRKHGKLDIMNNNAGVADFQQLSVAEYGMSDFERVMNVNVIGAMHGIKHASRVMIPNRKGSIISTSSVAGILGGATPYFYTASKHVLIGLTKNGAAELGKSGIRVNCISPPAAPTDRLIKYMGMTPSAETKAKVEATIQAFGNLKEVNLTAEDIAEAALYLASEDSKYVSGHNLVVDGGMSVVLDEKH